MASVQKRVRAGDRVTWRLSFRINGKQLSETFEDEAEARKWMGIFNAVGAAEGRRMLDAAIGEAPASSELTVRDLVADHIEALPGIQDGTRADYRRDAKYDIDPILGHLPVERLNSPDGRDLIEKWVNTLHSSERPIVFDKRKGGPLSGKTIENRHGLLSAACERAVRKGILRVNPCYGIRLPEATPEAMVFLTIDQWWQLYDVLPEYWRSFATLLVGTGLRFSEATALQVKHIDFERRQIRVTQAWKNRQGSGIRYIGPPKSKAGRRAVPFDPPVERALKVMVDGKSPDSFVAQTRAGDVVVGSTVHSWWGRALKKIELPERPRPHDLRHTFASWSLADGRVNIFMLAKIMGHEDVKVTAQRYGHLVPESMDAVARAVGRALERP